MAIHTRKIVKCIVFAGGRRSSRRKNVRSIIPVSSSTTMGDAILVFTSVHDTLLKYLKAYIYRGQAWKVVEDSELKLSLRGQSSDLLLVLQTQKAFF